MKVTFVFTTPKKFSLGSWVIKKRLGTKYSHVAITVHDEFTDTCDTYQAARGFVHCINSLIFLQTHSIVNYWRIELNPIEASRGLKFLKQQTGKQYGVLTALVCTFKTLRKLKIGNDDDKRFICSELALRFLEEAKGLDYSYCKDDDYVDPFDFENILESYARI